MEKENLPLNDDDLIFEGLIRASGVPVSKDEKIALRKAYSTLVKLSEMTRKTGRNWEMGMLPVYIPKPPKEENK